MYTSRPYSRALPITLSQLLTCLPFPSLCCGSNFMYIFLAISLCQTYGLFRVPFYKNVVLTALVFVEVSASILLVLCDWDRFDRFFQLTGPQLPLAYRHRLLILGLVTGMIFVLYERFCVPHKSLDEDPVALTAMKRLVTVGGKGRVQADGDGKEDDPTAPLAGGGEEDEWEAHEGEAEKEGVCGKMMRLWDSQPTVLPRWWYHTPRYSVGMRVVQA